MYGLSALPSLSTTLTTGSISTFIARISSTFMPSESKIKEAMQKDIDKYGLVETLNVSRGLFSNDYNIVFRIKKNIGFGSLSNIVKNSLQLGLGYNTSIVDVKSEFYEAPSPISMVVSPITEVTKAMPGVLSSVKWIAIAGLGIVGLFYLSPYLPKRK